MTRIRIVVGVDGSTSSTRAAEWAEHYAQCVDAEVVLVAVWHWPMMFGQPVSLPADNWHPAVDAQHVVEKVAAGLSLPSRQVHTHIVQGSAGDELVKLSAESDLVVVGTRGHGGVASAMLGSVSAYCVHHSHCPVVVVR